MTRAAPWIRSLLAGALALIAAGPLGAPAAFAIDHSADGAEMCVPEPPEPPPPPPECDQTVDVDGGADNCGCYYVKTVYGTPYEPCFPVTTINGILCSKRAGFQGTREDGLTAIYVQSPLGAFTLTVPEGMKVSIERMMEVAEILYAVVEIAGSAVTGMSSSFPEDLTSIGSWLPTGGAKVVGAGDVEIDRSFQDFDRLEVHGVYIALRDLTVSGRCEIDGVVYVKGKLTCGELEVRGQEKAGLRYGGILLAGPIVAESLTADHGFVYTRDIWTDDGGGLTIATSADVQASVVEAGPLFRVGAVPPGELSPLTVGPGSAVRADTIEAAPIDAQASTFSRVSELRTVDLTANQCTVSAGTSLTVEAGGAITLTATTITSGDVSVTAESMVFDATSRIDAAPGAPTELSLAIAAEPQNTMLALFQVPGASYGGYGGTEGALSHNNFRPAAAPVGDARHPTGPGVHGWSMPWNEHTAGGGEGREVALTIADRLVLAGTIAANGGHAPGSIDGGGGSGGSGGTIRVKAGELSGDGTLRANGGDGTLQVEGNDIGQSAGGGSGGRIAVTAGAFDALDLAYEAVGGLGGQVKNANPENIPPWKDWRAHGGPGTFYLVEEGEPGLLVIDGHGVDAAGSGCTGKGPECRGVGWLPADPGDTDVVLRHATVATKGLKARSLTLEDAVLRPDDPRVRLHWPLPDLDYEGVDFSAAQVYYPMSVWSNPLDETLTIELSRDLVVDAASRIDLSGFGGYSRNEADDYATCWAGGSHGGVGGEGKPGSQPALPAKPAFGDPAHPTTVGLGGCSGVNWSGKPQAQCGLGGVGGGALRLVVGEDVRVEGALRVDGGDGRPELEGIYCIDQQGTAGGAGGSLWVTAGSLAGSGVLSAAGGSGAAGFEGGVCGGGGGGGRIAIEAELSGWSGTFDVTGALGCDLPKSAAETWRGGDGTLAIDEPKGGGCTTGRGDGPGTGLVGGVLALAFLALRRRRLANA